MRALILGLIGLASAGLAQAADIVVPMNKVNEKGTVEPAGQVFIRANQYGTLLEPHLTGLSPGLHGFHLHANGSCQPGEKGGGKVAALKAGGHWDPDETGRHAGPYGDGHRGDLPAIYVDGSGKAEHSVLAPRLEPREFRGHALIVHSHGDNYADSPAALGGGGARVACGVVPEG